MDMMPQWTRLECDCGSDKFVKLTHIRFHPGQGGSSEEPGGFQCSNCAKHVNTAELIEKAKLEAKKAELKALQEQIGQK